MEDDYHLLYMFLSFVAIALTVMTVVSFLERRKDNEIEVKSQAIERGFAHYEINKYGVVVFEWNK